MSDLLARLRDADNTRRIGESYSDTHERRQRDREEAASRITQLEAALLEAASRITQLEAALLEAADELDAYYRAEYPGDHPYSKKKLVETMAANPARAALGEDRT